MRKFCLICLTAWHWTRLICFTQQYLLVRCNVCKERDSNLRLHQRWFGADSEVLWYQSFVFYSWTRKKRRRKKVSERKVIFLSPVSLSLTLSLIRTFYVWLYLSLILPPSLSLSFSLFNLFIREMDWSWFSLLSESIILAMLHKTQNLSFSNQACFTFSHGTFFYQTFVSLQTIFGLLEHW